MSAASGATGFLPAGTWVRVSSRTWTRDSGRTLIGGSPARLVRLGTRAAELTAAGSWTVSDRATSNLADRLVERGLADPDPGSLPVVLPADLTVVVPVRDRVGQLSRLLASLQGLDVIVVDDASRDPGAVAAAAAEHGAHLIPLSSNIGPAGARNRGIRAVGTQYVAFVDSDVTVTPEALLLMARHFADPRVAAVGPRIRGVPTSGTRQWFERYEESSSSFDFGPRAMLVRPHTSVAWLPSACLVVRLDDLTAANGFNSDLRIAEDVDLVWRLSASGRHVRYEPATTAYHDTRSTFRAWLGRKFDYGTGAANLASLHGDLVAPAVLTPGTAAQIVGLLAQRGATVSAALGLLAFATARTCRQVDDHALGLKISSRSTQIGAHQGAALIVRHWWPLAAVLSLFSRRARRAVAVAAAADGLVAWSRSDTSLDPIRFLAAKRLDDLAYGSGVWAGALRARSFSALRPVIRSR